MKQFFLLFVSCIAFLLQPIIGSAYLDVEPQTELDDATFYLVNQGILDHSRNEFHPYHVLSRAELTKVTLLAAGLPIFEAPYAPFPDVDSMTYDTKWAKNVIYTAKLYGIIDGYEDGTFRPWASVSWAEAMKIIFRTLYPFSFQNETQWLGQYEDFALEHNFVASSFWYRYDIYSIMPRKYMALMLYRSLYSNAHDLSFFVSPRNYELSHPSTYTLVISKLGIEAPVVASTTSQQYYEAGDWDAFEKSMLDDLVNGVVHYPYTAYPGESGNVVITGHSSYYKNKPGNYKDVFANLSSLENGDIVSLESSNNTYTYRVVQKDVVLPSQVNVLQQDLSRNTLTLITCYPTGTAQKRLVVTLEQLY